MPSTLSVGGGAVERGSVPVNGSSAAARVSKARPRERQR